ncbi:hypothetical protein Y032_0846g2661 [Ancylostoma ceylanicum]|uniref:Uncharacterized protein n=1 Tax=Ancylostoma ceylanicum TaxID=53326 RepID=A0A016WB77_9BILA|nr:hypothetical protein Y032_0846g2661 [Ancylostoma ceylanicum]
MSSHHWFGRPFGRLHGNSRSRPTLQTMSPLARRTWPYYLRRVSRSLSEIGAMPNRSRIFSLRMRSARVIPAVHHNIFASVTLSRRSTPFVAAQHFAP